MRGDELHAVSAEPVSRVGRSLGVVGVCLAVSGVLVNAYLALVARSVTPIEYSYFGAFWSLALIVGFGAFLPVEQELARRLQAPADPSATLRDTATVATGLALIEALLVLLAAPLLLPAVGGRWGTIAALAALCLASAVQFVVRGGLIGHNQLARHGALLVTDTVLRVGFAALVAATLTATSTAYAWTLVAAISIAHVPVLGLWIQRTLCGGSTTYASGILHTRGRDGPAAVARAVGPLLVGSLCAQLLMNGAPVLASAVATVDEQATAGRFLAAFTLARIPLFVAVPLQTSLLPAFSRLIAVGRGALRDMLNRLTLAIVTGGGVAAAAAYVAGPWVVGLVFGQEYVLPGADLALLALGVAAYLGLLVVTQGLVVSALHAEVARSWMVGLAVNGLVFAVVPDLLARAELAFLLGSAAGWVTAAVRLVARSGEGDARAERA